MQTYEYRVVPAPKRAEKVKGLKTTQDRFAHGLTQLMNDLGRDGWEYQRADTLPCEERVGLTGRTTTFQHMLVFRRALPGAGTGVDAVAAAPTPVAPAPVVQAEPVPAKAPLAASRPAAVRPADRVLADYASLAAQPAARKLTAEAPVGEAPRISLVQPLPETVPPVGPAKVENASN